MKRCPVIPSHRFCSETIKGVMEKSWKKGVEKGVEQGILSSIKSLMETMDWTLDQAMVALKVPEAERQTYQNLLQKQS